jgi:lipopolysaccharide/colanic/teichoic acid biosynthesis glycosyltransferase
VKTRIIIVFLDHVLILLSFAIVAALRGHSPLDALIQRQEGFMIFVALHLLLSLVFDKYNFRRREGLRKTVMPVIYTNLAMVAIVSIISVITGFTSFSRLLFFGTLLITSLVELIVGMQLCCFQSMKKQPFYRESTVVDNTLTLSPIQTSPPLLYKNPKRLNQRVFHSLHGTYIKQSVIAEHGYAVFEFLKEHVPMGSSSVILSVRERINILGIPYNKFKTIINLHKVNNHRYVNKFFEVVNMKLPFEGIYCSFCETKEARKKYFFKYFGKYIGWIPYTIDYILHRVFPKINFTKKLYFRITKGKGRVISRAELLGRLYSCGFIVEKEAYVNGKLFFIARKVEIPAFDRSPTYGPLIKLSRVGKDGKIISIYKYRTMHPYAEYLQEYVYEKKDLADGGKFNDDFRITNVGRFMRKLWIDELPMLINLLQGDIKLVGVRPLSQHYFSLYTPELQQRRIKYKPGLLPPFYADLPGTLEEIMASEMKYLDSYDKHPFITDWKYFWKIWKNIIVKKARSQ